MSGPVYFPCLLVQNLLQKLMVDTKRYHVNQIQIKLTNFNFKPYLKSNNVAPRFNVKVPRPLVMQVLPLHHYPEYKEQCCRLLNEQWKRSETARMQSLTTSCDQLPTNLILLHQNNVIGHSKLSIIPSVRDACYVESVVIDRELRGKGYGKYLMQKVEQHCSGLGLKRIYLSTKDKVEFYSKLGYVSCEPISIYGQYVRNTSVDNISAVYKKPDDSKSIKSDSLPPPPPPLPPDLYIGINCSKKVFMSKVLD